MDKVIAATGIVGFVILVFVLAILWPLVIIWALNTLFGFGIAYSFLNWLAMLVLTMSFGKAKITTKTSN